MFAIMTSSPNLALFQIEFDGMTPWLSSNPRNPHERVVCSFLPLFSNTDNTFGCSTTSFYKKGIYQKKKTTTNRKIEKKCFVVIISNFLSQLLHPLPKLQQNHLCALCTSKILTLLLYRNYMKEKVITSEDWVHVLLNYITYGFELEYLPKKDPKNS